MSLGKGTCVADYAPDDPAHIHLRKGDTVDIFFKGVGAFAGIWKGECARTLDVGLFLATRVEQDPPAGHPPAPVPVLVAAAAAAAGVAAAGVGVGVGAGAGGLAAPANARFDAPPEPEGKDGGEQNAVLRAELGREHAAKEGLGGSGQKAEKREGGGGEADDCPPQDAAALRCATAGDAEVALALAQTLGKKAAQEHKQTQERYGVVHALVDTSAQTGGNMGMAAQRGVPEDSKMGDVVPSGGYPGGPGVGGGGQQRMGSQGGFGGGAAVGRPGGGQYPELPAYGGYGAVPPLGGVVPSVAPVAPVAAAARLVVPVAQAMLPGVNEQRLRGVSIEERL